MHELFPFFKRICENSGAVHATRVFSCCCFCIFFTLPINRCKINSTSVVYIYSLIYTKHSYPTAFFVIRSFDIHGAYIIPDRYHRTDIGYFGKICINSQKGIDKNRFQ